ncbi:hypothetical protein FMM05_20600 [Flavobacterium zepuense]|uniref:Lipocalin-like domain-containing protein n=1 Tax=Flavobacterium zepuense TaxID=2593302 RepID=A0A552US83_9FLAO|nr:hypothetical protein [Flavobacterium zepuense]TRW21091.1 hypothetical protein FMM05_20600 [Flavobacterium zepuense]
MMKTAINIFTTMSVNRTSHAHKKYVIVLMLSMITAASYAQKDIKSKLISGNWYCVSKQCAETTSKFVPTDKSGISYILGYVFKKDGKVNTLHDSHGSGTWQIDGTKIIIKLPPATITYTLIPVDNASFLVLKQDDCTLYFVTNYNPRRVLH